MRKASQDILSFYISQEQNGENLNLIEKETETLKFLSAKINRLNGEKKIIKEAIYKLQELLNARNLQARDKVIAELRRLEEEFDKKEKEAIEAQKQAEARKKDAIQAQNQLEEYKKRLKELEIKLKLKKLDERTEKKVTKAEAAKSGELLEDKVKGGNTKQKRTNEYILNGKVITVDETNGRIISEKPLEKVIEAENVQTYINPTNGLMTDEEYYYTPENSQKIQTQTNIQDAIKPAIITINNTQTSVEQEAKSNNEQKKKPLEIKAHNTKEQYKRKAVKHDKLRQEEHFHIVKWGENLTIIAKQYNIGILPLLRVNPGINSKDLIKIGEKIRIPTIDKK